MDKERMKAAGQILLNLRHEYGLTQRIVAERVAVIGPSCSVRHYRRLEKGQMLPSVALAMAVCSVLDADVYQVWG